MASNNQFNGLVALFLAEIIRSRRTSLRRAAEISNWVIRNLPKMTSETAILGLLTDIERDFEEVAALKQALHFGYKELDIKVFEHEIRQYASDIFAKDMVLSAAFLQDASKSDMDIQRLCLKYPDFCNYLINSTEKAQLLSGIQNLGFSS